MGPLLGGSDYPHTACFPGPVKPQAENHTGWQVSLQQHGEKLRPTGCNNRLIFSTLDLRQVINLSEPQGLHPSRGDNNCACLLDLLQSELKIIIVKSLKQSVPCSQ